MMESQCLWVIRWEKKSPIYYTSTQMNDRILEMLCDCKYIALKKREILKKGLLAIYEL